MFHCIPQVAMFNRSKFWSFSTPLTSLLVRRRVKLFIVSFFLWFLVSFSLLSKSDLSNPHSCVSVESVTNYRSSGERRSFHLLCGSFNIPSVLERRRDRELVAIFRTRQLSFGQVLRAPFALVAQPMKEKPSRIRAWWSHRRSQHFAFGGRVRASHSRQAGRLSVHCLLGFIRFCFVLADQEREGRDRFGHVAFAPRSDGRRTIDELLRVLQVPLSPNHRFLVNRLLPEILPDMVHVHLPIRHSCATRERDHSGFFLLVVHKRVRGSTEPLASPG